MNPRLCDYHRALITGDVGSFSHLAQRALLRLAAVPYGAAIAARNHAYDHGWLAIRRAAVPVVSVGNLTAGGTGKTPCVEALARWLIDRNVQPAILSRGYGSSPDHRDPQRRLNDEALLLRDNLPGVPHLLGADRIATARQAVERYGSQILLLDDGFQHRRLARDLDIVLLDATNPWGFGHLLPRGLLREPARGLRRAQLVILTRCDQADADTIRKVRARVAFLAPDAAVAAAAHRPVDLVNADLETTSFSLLNRPIAAFCGLGNPEAFHRTLLALGARSCAFRSFPDHHAYTLDDIRDLQRWVSAQPPGCVVLTSQKDLVKLRRTHLGGRELWAVRVRLEFLTGHDALDRLLGPLVARVAGRRRARAA